ncbi:UDP-N-acetyl-D-mannosamine dehydrogenase [Sphingorhabdus sp. Alg239-R122]|uniref:UDP-N-acetyl-D-mannosamine dehydrogenase n=1 Tax=Sphingorhabdus sp. Alg239-R122 TaxID=2305989 RepID=UPI0013DB52A0|nr:UDP-N-acetyl-D-mannosamine dehydrogenase [Sphingorhabdus sp. Alg239-R122]
MQSDTLPNVTMVGLGYIGLPTAAVIAQSGCNVLGLDVKQDVVDTINRGEIHIEEHDLDVLVRDMVACGRLSASMEPRASDVFLIAVPTPFVGDHVPDITYVLDAAKRIAPVLKKGDLVILESTSPIGTTDKMAALLAEERPDLKIAKAGDGDMDVHVAYCPERVLPGQIIAELVSNDRSIGGITPHCAEKARGFYQIFVKGECIETTAATAEMVKLVENASRDVSIAFANELSLIADKMDLNVWDVIELANRHPRVNILQPGPGVGGHCIAVDPWFLVDSAPDETPLIATARRVNDGKSDYVIGRVEAMADAHPDAKIACLGLSFKANIDDFRESPALKVAQAIAAKYGERVQIVEPYASELPHQFDGSAARLVDIDTAMQDCDIVILLVDHKAFADMDKTKLEGKEVYDTRGQWRHLA